MSSKAFGCRHRNPQLTRTQHSSVSHTTPLSHWQHDRHRVTPGCPACTAVSLSLAHSLFPLVRFVSLRIQSNTCILQTVHMCVCLSSRVEC